jgi:ArsR family transcriptional regulator
VSRQRIAREHDRTMKTQLAIAKALSDANRVRMLCALRGGELCVCQLIDLLRLAPSTVSKHLSIMSQAGLIESRKDGRWVYYRLPRKPARDGAAGMTRETFKALRGDAMVAEDEARLAQIRQSDLEARCKKNL